MFNFKRIILFFISIFIIVPVNQGLESGIVVETLRRQQIFNGFTDLIYHNIESQGISFDAFKKGVQGYLNLKEQGRLENTGILTIVDFSQSSKNERLFILDMNTWTIQKKMLVSHGRNTGEEFARNFSNQPGSYTSSLGFYLTAEVYEGRNGTSMRLDGLEPGFNDKARERAIVIHGADYVSEQFISGHGRLGRSQGCPAVSAENLRPLLQTISNKSCFFVYFPDKRYISKSRILANNAYLNTFSVNGLDS